MSGSAQYGERGGFMQQSQTTHATSNFYGFGNGDSTQLNSTSSNAHSITEHDYRFPRRPADDQHNYYGPSFAPDTDSLYDFGALSPAVDEDKLDFSAAESVASKGMLRESIFPSWKDDAAGGELDSPDEMQKKDPLATQIWRLYSKTKKQLPNQERMENLTWRMMAMNLRKRKQEDAARYVSACCFQIRISLVSRLSRQNNSAPSGIAQLRNSSDQSHENSDLMNLDDFIFSDNISTPSGMSPVPESKEKDGSKSSNAVASAIPIKMRKEPSATFVPQSVPVQQHRAQGKDEFGYVQRHVRKTSIDERRVSHRFCTFKILSYLSCLSRSIRAALKYPSLGNDQQISHLKFLQSEL
jgi:GATA-binding protein